MRKKHLYLLGAFLLFVAVVFLFSPAQGPGFSQDAMQQAERAAFGYDLPCTSVKLVLDEVIEWVDPGMEYAVRQLLQRPEGDIRVSDLDHITALELYCNSAEGTGSISVNEGTLKHLTDEPVTMTTVTYELPTEIPWIQNTEDLRHFIGLQQLSIGDMSLAPGIHMPPVSLSGLSYCHGLRVLTISGLETENQEVLMLSNLAVLSLSGSPLESPELLGQLTTLENLELYRYDLADLSPLANLHELKTLILSGCRIGSLEPLAQLPELKNLKLDGKAMYPSLEPLAEMKLEFLSLNCESLPVGTDAYDHLDYAPLTKIPTLISLDLANHRNVDAALCTAILENAPDLQYLRIDRTPAARELPKPDGLLFYGNAY